MLDVWLASFAFSRSVRHAPRDFSDAVLLAELLAQLLPAGAVALHNYPSTGRYQQKLINWDLLNRKVLASIGCELSRQQIEDLAGAVAGAITVLLARVKQETEKRHNSTGRPLRSPIKTGPAAATAVKRTSAQLMRAAQPVPKHSMQILSSAGQSRSGSVQKASVRRGAATTVSSANSTSPSRSAPTSPRKSDRSKTPPPSRSSSKYTLLDYLPLPSERPKPEDLVNTFELVLQVPEDRRNTQRKDSPVWATRKSTAPPPPQLPIATAPANPDSSSHRFFEKGIDAQPAPSDITFSSPNQFEMVARLSFAEDSAGCQSQEIREGGFALLESRAAAGFVCGGAIQLVRVIKKLSLGCLVQLFKAFEPSKRGSSSDGKSGFVSTPHFIECFLSQLRAVNGIHFDSVASVWTFDPSYARKRVWPASPTYTKPSSPLNQYTTTILSRHKFSAADAHAPIMLRSTESASTQASQETPGSRPGSFTSKDLSPRPTVFTPVKVDVSGILETLPDKFPRPLKNNRA